jgi:A/G-specific adenine glycosylase
MQWYRHGNRDLPWRRTDDPWAIWVSEIMLQQTQVKTVIPYYTSFLDRFPDINTMARASLDEVIKAWEGLGYYARVRNLHKATQLLAQTNSPVPSDPLLFRELPGVGEYVCAAVQSIAFGHPMAAVDGNVKRVIARLFGIRESIDRAATARMIRAYTEDILDPQDPGTFTQALMELGAVVCRPNHPDCAECPLESSCVAKREQCQDSLPVRAPRKAVPSYQVAVGVVEDGDRMLITRRPPEGLLGGLWEFPGGKIEKDETPEQACVREIAEEVSLDVDVVEFVTRVRHAYTHFKVELDVFLCRYKGGKVALNSATDYRWITREEFEQYAFPKANHKFIPFLLDDARDPSK